MNVDPLESARKQISYYSDSNRIFFDSTSFTLISNNVLNSMSSFFQSGGARPTTGLYPGTSLASTTIESCRQSCKDFFSVKSGEMAFPGSRGIGVLQTLYSLSLTFDFVLFAYTGLDHDIWLPAFEFAKHKRFSFNAIPIKNSEDELFTEIATNFKGITDQLIVLIVPLRSLGNGLSLTKNFFDKLKKNTNIIIIADCTFAVGVSKILFSDLAIDFAVFDSNIGLGGPIGSGILYIKENFVNQMSPYVFLGNGSINKVTSTSYSLEDMPQRLETSINPGVIAGLQTALDHINHLSLASISNHINSLKNLFLDLTKTIKDVKLTGTYSKDNFTNIVGLVIPNVNMHEIAMYLDEVCEIDVRTGSFCAHQLIDQLYANLNLNQSNLGILQVSFHYYNTTKEIIKLFEGLKEFLDIIQ